MPNKKACIYAVNPARRLPTIWTDDKCYDFLDHMFYLTEQGVPPFYIAVCCGLDRMIAKQPYDYDGIRRWISYHHDFVQKVWQTVCIAPVHML